jgi:hypothetical protein
MRQTIHIFIKDVWHWRWAIAGLIALLAARTAVTPRYSPIYHPGWGLNRTIDLLNLLLPVAWWFLVAIVIHDESLVGDRQFWLTRPYSWKSLLAAKLLFVGVIVMAPLLVSDAIVLALSGFSPRVLAGELLWFEATKAIILAPALILASITKGMRQFLLGSLLVILYLARPVTNPPIAWELALIFVVPLQFALRRTTLVRSVVVAGLLVTAIPFRVSRADIPEVGSPVPEVAIRFDPSRQRLDWRNGAQARDRIEVNLPIDLTGRRRDLLNGTLVDLEITDRGQVWHPRPDWRANLTRRDDADWLEIAFREPDYRRFKNDAVRVQAEFAVWVYEPQTTVTLRRGAGWQPVDGMGYARLDPDPPHLPLVTWRTPFSVQEQKLVYTIPLLGTNEVQRGESSGIYRPSNIDMHISPVVTQSGRFFPASYVDPRTWIQPAKPGEPQPRPPDATLQVLRPVALVRRWLTIEGLRLADWVVTPR